MKLEANLEYRFPMFWKLCGAVFTDVGNIWTLKETDGDDGSHTHFDLKNLAGSLAADWGIGLRVDLNFLILRLDMGMKVYDPSLRHRPLALPVPMAKERRLHPPLRCRVSVLEHKHLCFDEQDTRNSRILHVTKIRESEVSAHYEDLCVYSLQMTTPIVTSVRRHSRHAECEGTCQLAGRR